MASQFDAVIIGSGPNGLSAGIYLADKGLKVCILEGHHKVGGGMRTEELTLPGYHHDVCSAVHPMAYLSPYFKDLKLEQYGLEWIFPEVSVAHPLDNEPAVLLAKSIDETARGLGEDENRYKNLITEFAENAEHLFKDALKPLGIPKHPLLLARFGSKAFMPATWFAKHFLKDKRSKALFAGCAAHSILPLDNYFTTALGLIFLTSGHAVNWPMPKGGSQALADALLKCFISKGGQLFLNNKIDRFNQLPEAKAYFFDTNPHQLACIAKDQLGQGYLNRIKKYNYGPGVFKIDYALDGPIPWKDPNCLKASTLHLGGSFEEIALAEKEVWQGIHNERPYVLLSQQSQFDNTRAPQGKHTCWAYCHVPNGSEQDMTQIIENQIERFAPGFKDIILAKHNMGTSDFEKYNPNYVGGAVTGGAADISQLFTRPVLRRNPYSTPNPKIFICSASTPPGGGVHGMCGYWAADSAFKKKLF
ncbi:MAG: phytoene dehydrogenase-like protein [Limisphaerales bacterium]|jgi:phytoene dehydrogenase-like protein